ncbi:MAG: leucine-rich repeat protein [Clostridia bacterium]|nr:leucine-rich repeat protein [Clostridia bacterium]
MKKKILSIFLSILLIFSAVPSTSIGAFATSDDCLMYGHAFEWIETVEATCTTDGYEIIKCSVCGFTDTLEYTATGHTDANKDESCDDCGEFMPATSGKCGDSLTWQFYESSGKLSIYGSGDMYEYTADNRPWRYFADDVTTISVGTGVTAICDYAFYDFKAATSATIYNGATTIGNYAFYNCESLLSITISNTVTSIGENAFDGCSSLTNVYYEELEDNWNAITIGKNNQPLLDATIHCKILDSGTCGDSLTWVFDERISTLTISGTGAMYDYDSNNRPWEDYEDIIKKLVINDGVTTIGDYAAYSCSKLATVTIPDSVITIGNRSFSGCRFNQVTIGNSVTTIGDYAFSVCNYLSSITIPESVTTIGAGAFYSCTSLHSVYYTGFIQDWKNVTIGDNNTALLNATMHYKETDSGVCGDNLTWVYDEPTSTLTISGTGAMYDYNYSNRPWENYEENIKEVVIDDGVTTIGVSAFYSCHSLQSVTIPSSVTTIGDDVFVYCTSLEEIIVDENNGSYSNDEYGVLFDKDKTILITYPAGNTITHYYVPVSVTTIADRAFQSCNSITDINYPGSSSDWSKISIGNYNNVLVNATKHYNYVTSGTCGDNLTWVFDESTSILTISGTGAMYDYWSGNQPWRGCDDYIKEIVIKDGVTTIGIYAFGDMDSFTSITIPNSVTIIDDYAFYFSGNIANVTIPNSVTTIGKYAFLACDSLTNITIPASVTTIGQDAFSMSENLTSITVESNNKNYSNDEYGVLFNKDKTTLIQYPTGNANTSYTIPDSVTTIENEAFGYCHLTNVTFGKGITSLGYMVFYRCDNLTKVTVDSNNKYFSNDEYGVLFNKNKTTLVYHPKGNTRTSYVIPDTVTKIADNAFYACENLTGVTIPDSVTTIGERTFYYCTNLESVIIPDGVTTINYYTFGACWNLFSVTIPSSVTTIDENAFSSCEYLGSVYGTVFYSGTAKDWSEISIDANGNEPLLSATIVYNYVDPNRKITGTCGDNLIWTFEGSTGKLTISGHGAIEDYSTGNRPWQDFKDDIETVIIGDGVTAIGMNAFYSCYSLSSITIGSGVTAIDDSAFTYCSALESIMVDSNNKNYSSDEYGVLFNKDKTTLIRYPAYNAKTDYTVPDNVTTINDGAFWPCIRLTSVIIPSGVTTIGERTFYRCDKLTDVYYLGTEAQWNEISMGNYNASLLDATIHYNYTPPFTGIKDNHFYKDGVMQKAYQLVEFDGDFYFIGDRHEIVKNKKVSLTEVRINGLTYADGSPILPGSYNFDENGKMIILNGVVGKNIYKNNTKLKAYQLVEVDGEFYFIGDRHEIVKNQKVNLTDARINGLTYADGTPILAGVYEFDENGKMIMREGIVGNYVYKNNVQQKAYQLVEVDGDFYFIGDRHEIIKGRKVYLSEEKINGLTYADGTPIAVGSYDFDENGKMIILNGIVGNNIYKNNAKLKAYQLVEVDGDFYFIGDRHEIVKNKRIYLNEERINGLTYADGTPITVGHYNVDADGKLIIE